MAQTFAAASRPPGRRHILGALLGLPMVASVPVMATSADHALIAAVDGALAMQVDINRLVEHATEWWTDERLCAVCDEQRAMVVTACTTPARTPEGLAAKARMLLDRHRNGEGDQWVEEMCILTSLCRDLIGDPAA